MVRCNGNGLLMSANITEHVESVKAKDTRGLYCNRDKMVRPGQQNAFPPSGFYSCGVTSVHCTLAGQFSL